MKTISILVPEGAILGSLEGSRQIFTKVNAFLQGSSQVPFFQVQLVGLSKNVYLNDGLFTVNSNVLINETTHTDLIIIPALDGDLRHALEINKAFIPWIIEHYKKGAEVASLCLGAFLLASTGLLNGRK